MQQIPSMREIPPSAPARKSNGWVAAAIVMGTLILVGGCFNFVYAASHNICFTIYHAGSPPRILTAGGVAIAESSSIRAFRISDGTLLWQEPSGVLESAFAADDHYLYNATLGSNSNNGGTGTVSARDRSTAAIVWQATTPSYALILKLVVTPTSVIGLIASTTGILMAWQRTDGRLLWQATATQHSIDARDNSITLAGAALIYHDQSNIQAFDPATGHTLWHFADNAYANDIVTVSTNATSLIMQAIDPTTPLDSKHERLIAFQPTTGKPPSPNRRNSPPS
jgi:outer membrane protein assembly factor BamB